MNISRNILAAATVLSGCVSQPAQTPPLPTPQAQWAARFNATEGAPIEWSADFEAPGLADLIHTALQTNYDLDAAAARVAAARARANIAGAPLWPQVEASAEAARRKIRTSDGTPVTQTNYALDGFLSWEVDVWGRLRNTARAAAQDAEASQADYRGARLSLTADVARGWFSVIESELQVQLAERTTESFRRTNAVIEERYRSGLGTALDIRLARENLASAEAVLAARQRDREARIRALEVLLGRLPTRELATVTTLPSVRRDVPAGLPLDLLTRRPDLVAADLRLRAAGERLDEARKNRLPSLRLTASGGTASGQLHDLLNWDYLVWSLVAGVTQPIFQGGRLKAEEALARAEHREVWADYASTLLRALQEVETTLASESLYVAQAAALSVASREAKEAADLALDRYQRGLIDIITLQEAQRRAFTAESAYLQTARQRLDNRVTLYTALGGNFDEYTARQAQYQTTTGVSQ